MNWFKRLFCKEEVRVIEPLNPNQVLAQIISSCLKDNKIKNYANLARFVESFKGEPLDSKLLELKNVTEVTPEIEMLKHNWKLLKYRCSDKELDSFMKS